MAKKSPKKRASRRPSKLEVDVLEARSISLVDDTGRARVELMHIAGYSVMHFYDKTGLPRLTLQVGDGAEAGVMIFAPGGKFGVTLAATQRGNGLTIDAPIDGAGRIDMGCVGPKSSDPRGHGPQIDVLDPDRQRTWSVFNGTQTIPSGRALQDVAANESGDAAPAQIAAGQSLKRKERKGSKGAQGRKGA